MKPNANCRDVADWLPWYVNGTLDAEQCDLLHAHVAKCETCGESLQIEHRMADRLLSRPTSTMDSASNAWHRLAAKLDEEQLAAERAPSAGQRPWQAAALGAVAIVALSLLAMQSLRQPPAMPPSADYRTLATDAPSVTTKATAIDLAVASELTAADVRRLAMAIGADVAGGPDSLNRYRLILPADNQMTLQQNAASLPIAAASWLRQQRGVVQVRLVNTGAAP